MSADVAGGAIRIAGPEGYCIDSRAMRDRGDSAVVLMASCAAIAGSARQPQPRHAAVLMASVSAADRGVLVADSLPLLRDFFGSEAGRAALSQDGQAENVEVLDIGSEADALVIHARDHGETLAGNLQDTYWRALFDLRERTVSATVYSTTARPISSDTGRALLLRFIARIREANQPQPAGDAPPAS